MKIFQKKSSFLLHQFFKKVLYTNVQQKVYRLVAYNLSFNLYVFVKFYSKNGTSAFFLVFPFAIYANKAKSETSDLWCAVF